MQNANKIWYVWTTFQYLWSLYQHYTVWFHFYLRRVDLNSHFVHCNSFFAYKKRWIITKSENKIKFGGHGQFKEVKDNFSKNTKCDIFTQKHIEEKTLKLSKMCILFKWTFDAFPIIRKNMYLQPECPLWSPLALSSIYYFQSNIFLCLEALLHRVESDGSTALTDISHLL